MTTAKNEISSLTKEYLKKAMLNMMATTPFDRITITDLVSKAGVSRTAFYRNYTSKEELVIEMIEDMNQMFLTLDVGSVIDMSMEMLESFFSTLLRQRRELILALHATLENTPMLRKEKKFQELLMLRIGTASYENAAKYGAFHAILLQWIMNGMKDEPARIAEITYNELHKM